MICGTSHRGPVRGGGAQKGRGHADGGAGEVATGEGAKSFGDANASHDGTRFVAPRRVGLGIPTQRASIFYG